MTSNSKQKASLHKKWQQLQTRTELSIFRVAVHLHNAPVESADAGQPLTDPVSVDSESRFLTARSFSRGRLRDSKIQFDHCFGSDVSPDQVYESAYMNLLGEGAAQGFNTGLFVAGMGRRFNYDRTLHFTKILESFSNSVSHLDAATFSYCHFGIPGSVRCLDLVSQAPIEPADLKKNWHSYFRPLEDINIAHQQLRKGCTIPNILVIRVENKSLKNAFIGTLYLVDLGRPSFVSPLETPVDPSKPDDNDVTLTGPFGGIWKVADCVSGLNSPGPIPYLDHAVTAVCSEMLGGNGLGMLLLHIDAQDIDIPTIITMGKFSDSLRRIRNRTAMVRSDPRLYRMETECKELSDTIEHYKKRVEEESTEIEKKDIVIHKMQELLHLNMELSCNIEKDFESALNQHSNNVQVDMHDLLATLHKKYEKTLIDLKSAESELRVASEEYALLETIQANQISAFQSQRELISSLQFELSNSRTHYNELIKSHETYRKKSIEMLKEKDGAIEKLSSEIQEMRGKYQNLLTNSQEEAQLLFRECARIKDDSVKELESTKRECEKSEKILNDTARKLRVEVDFLSKQVDEKNAELKSIREELKKLSFEAENDKKTIRKLSTDCENFSEELEKMLKTLEQERMTRAEVEAKESKAVRNVERLETKLEILEEKSKSDARIHEDTITHLKEMMKDMKIFVDQQLQSSKDQNDSLRSQLLQMTKEANGSQNNKQLEFQRIFEQIQVSTKNQQDAQLEMFRRASNFLQESFLKSSSMKSKDIDDNNITGGDDFTTTDYQKSPKKRTNPTMVGQANLEIELKKPVLKNIRNLKIAGDIDEPDTKSAVKKRPGKRRKSAEIEILIETPVRKRIFEPRSSKSQDPDKSPAIVEIGNKNAINTHEESQAEGIQHAKSGGSSFRSRKKKNYTVEVDRNKEDNEGDHIEVSIPQIKFKSRKINTIDQNESVESKNEVEIADKLPAVISRKSTFQKSKSGRKSTVSFLMQSNDSVVDDDLWISENGFEISEGKPRPHSSWSTIGDIKTAVIKSKGCEISSFTQTDSAENSPAEQEESEPTNSGKKTQKSVAKSRKTDTTRKSPPITSSFSIDHILFNRTRNTSDHNNYESSGEGDIATYKGRNKKGKVEEDNDTESVAKVRISKKQAESKSLKETAEEPRSGRNAKNHGNEPIKKTKIGKRKLGEEKPKITTTSNELENFENEDNTIPSKKQKLIRKSTIYDSGNRKGLGIAGKLDLSALKLPI